MSYMKSISSGAKGNMRLLKSYGAGSKGPRQAFASGGAVKASSDGPALDEGLSAEGGPAKPNLSRPGRKMMKKGGKDGKKEAKTNINIIVAGGKPDAGPMTGPPPMPPPGAGPGGPMPMRKSGGRVCKAEGGEISEDSKATAKKLRDDASRSRTGALTSGAVAVGTGLANRLGGGKLSRAIGHTLTGSNALFAGSNMRDAYKADSEADRIEKGRAEPGKEDRKFGGRTKMKKR